ncbi:hypothetical protein Tco_1278786 [Tanacetum coccineum]
MFQQHQGESLYDAWTHFKNLIQRAPPHSLDLWSLTQFFYYHVDNYTRMDLDFTADENLRELSGEEACEAIDSFAQGRKEWEKPFIAITKEELAILRAQIDELVGNKKVYTPPVTYLEEVEETIGILIEVETLDHMKLEDLGLNTNTHDLFLSSKRFPSVDEPVPQLLPNFSPLDVNLGDKRGTDPTINPYSPGSFKMKVVKPLTIHTPPSPHVAYLHQNSVYHYYHTHLMISVGETHGTNISQKDEKPSKKRQNQTRDGKVCEDEAQSKSSQLREEKAKKNIT